MLVLFVCCSLKNIGFRMTCNADVLQTDTASVLMEAIGYIKFLQNQVEVFLFSLLLLPSFLPV